MVGLYQGRVALQQALVELVAAWVVQYLVEEKRRLVFVQVGAQVPHQCSQCAQRLGMEVDELRGFLEAGQIEAVVLVQVFLGE